MRLLLDTHIALACIDRRLGDLPLPMASAVELPENSVWISVVNIWELAIKSRVGKFSATIDLDKWPDAFRLMEIGLQPVLISHVLADIGPEPPHKDPFDRLLLGVCAAEGLKLVTRDRALVNHPLSWRSFPS